MLLIAHRGNINGPNKELENTPSYIDEAICDGYEVEIDVWLNEDGLWLGHDHPDHKIDESFLTQRKNVLWCHAKNLAALVFLLSKNMNTFSHDDDPYVLTSRGYIWAHFRSPVTEDTIAVMPEWATHKQDLRVCKGVCSDFIRSFRDT